MILRWYSNNEDKAMGCTVSIMSSVSAFCPTQTLLVVEQDGNAMFVFEESTSEVGFKLPLSLSGRVAECRAPIVVLPEAAVSRDNEPPIRASSFSWRFNLFQLVPSLPFDLQVHISSTSLFAVEQVANGARCERRY